MPNKNSKSPFIEKQIDFFEPVQSVVERSENQGNCCPGAKPIRKEEATQAIEKMKETLAKKQYGPLGKMKKLFFFISLGNEHSQRAVQEAIRYSQRHPEVFVEGYFVDPWKPDLGRLLGEKRDWFQGMNGLFAIKSISDSSWVSRYFSDLSKMEIPAFVFSTENNLHPETVDAGIVYGVPDLEKYHHEMWK